MFAQLGDIIFEKLIGPESLDRSDEVSYAEHDLINQKPRLQKTGLGLTKIDLTIKFFDDFCVPEDEIAAFRAYMNQGAVLPYVLGTGVVVGQFVILSTSEQHAHCYPDGAIREATLTVTLKEYAQQDKEKREAAQAKSNATALAGNSPKTVRGQLKSYSTPEGQLTTATMFAQDQAKDIDSKIKSEASMGTLSAANIDRIARGIDQLNEYLGRAANILNGNASILSLVPNMPASIASSLNAAATLKTSLGMSSGIVAGASNSLQMNIAQAKVDGAKVIAKFLFRF